MQILIENNTEESKTSSQTAVEITIFRSRNGILDITEELEMNLHTQFQLKSRKMLKMINENHNKRILN